MQEILSGYDALREYIRRINPGKILLVHGRSLEKFTGLNEYIRSLDVIEFTGFTPNPKIEDAENAVKSSEGCGAVLAVGGGSTIDTAKYVRLKSPGLPLIVIPTTAGSGSEATKFAVLYRDGQKLSITDENIIPDAVMFDSGLLQYLPEYHRKSSALDAFSHALESFWSVNANDESRKFSREALSEITEILEGYPESYDAERMLKASYTAGRAINISQTTAGHAMCYKITGIFGTAHGHSAAMCNRILFRRLCENSGLYVLSDIASSMSCDSPIEAAEKFDRIFLRLNMNIPEASENDIEELTRSVNPVRLKNFPEKLDELTIRNLYRKILNVKE